MTNKIPSSDEVAMLAMSQSLELSQDAPRDHKAAQIQLLERLMEQKQPMLPVYLSERIEAVPLSTIQGELDSLKGGK